MGNKKIRKIIQKSNEELLGTLRKEILKITIVGTSKAIKQSLRGNSQQNAGARKTNANLEIDCTRPVSKMIGDLYERLSGTSSEGESYTFAIGRDAVLLKKIQNKLLRQEPIFIEDAKMVHAIYKKFFPQEAEKIQI